MEITDILKESLSYPLHNIKALILYLILGIILGIAVGGSAVAVIEGITASNISAVLGFGSLGVVISLILTLIISGYELDIIKYGIERNDGAPGIEFTRQFVNGVKLFVVNLVYYLIPLIIGAILSAISNHWAILVIEFILYLVFGLLALMGQCRLADTEDLAYSLAITEAFDDIQKVGFINLILFLIVIGIVAIILFAIAGAITAWNATIGGIILGIVGVYLTFFVSRATGLLYSKV